jgi:DNA-binding transcriptional LysR family regulator
VLPRAISSFREKYNGAVFEIETLHLDEMTEALLEARVDLGLAFDPDPAPGIEAETVAGSRFVVLVPADIDLKGKSSLSASDLCDYPFIGLNSRGPLGQCLSAYLAPIASDLEVVISSETYYVAKALAACGLGVTITDEITARSGNTEKLQVVPLQPELHFDIKVLSLASTPLSIAARNFIQHLTASINELTKP